MDLSETDLQEFCRIWREEFHEDISVKEARDYASGLLELYTTLARPLPSALQPKEKNIRQNK